jgi:hypothetical protein
MTPRHIVGGLLLLLAVLCLFALRGHAGMGLYARLLVMVVAGFDGTQVLRGKRIPGFSLRTRS